MKITARRMTADEENEIEFIAKQVEKFVDNSLGHPITDPEKAAWNLAYHTAINKRTIKAGLRVALR